MTREWTTVLTNHRIARDPRPKWIAGWVLTHEMGRWTRAYRSWTGTHQDVLGPEVND